VLPSEARVGFTTSAAWVGYSPAKNSIGEGVAKLRAGVGAMSPSTAEADAYHAHAEAGADTSEPPARRPFARARVRGSKRLPANSVFAISVLFPLLAAFGLPCLLSLPGRTTLLPFGVRRGVGGAAPWRRLARPSPSAASRLPSGRFFRSRRPLRRAAPTSPPPCRRLKPSRWLQAPRSW
jgi:hypothetical protein